MTETSTSGATSARDQLVERLFGATIAALDLLHIWVGERLGLYRTLAQGGPATAAELAARAGIAERYAREWLEHQAVAGLLAVSDTADPRSRTFSIPPGHDEVLLDRDSLSYMTPLALGVVGMAQALPRVLEAFQTGSGVRYEAYGADTRHFISWINRPMFATCWRRSGSRGSPGWWSGCGPILPLAWPMSGAAPGGRRSRSRVVSRRRS
jgi:hypothetical protein